MPVFHSTPVGVALYHAHLFCASQGGISCELALQLCKARLRAEGIDSSSAGCLNIGGSLAGTLALNPEEELLGGDLSPATEGTENLLPAVAAAPTFLR